MLSAHKHLNMENVHVILYIHEERRAGTFAFAAGAIEEVL